MPRIRQNNFLANPAAVTKLIERYIKIERRITVDEAVGMAGCSRTLYYNRLRDPANLTLAELRNLSKALKIPQEEMSAALAEAIRY